MYRENGTDKIGTEVRNSSLTFIVNTRNKDTFTNNFYRREIFKVPLNPSDKRGKTREKILSYLFPLSGELGDLGVGCVLIESVSLILTSTLISTIF